MLWNCKTREDYKKSPVFSVVEEVAERVSETQPNTGLPYPVKVKKSSIKNAGNGVFATRDIEKSEIVCFYDGIHLCDSGWVKWWDECIFKQYKHRNMNTFAYYIAFVSGRDGYFQNYADHYVAGYTQEFNQGGVGQLINDYTTDYSKYNEKNYNVTMWGNRPYMVARRDIKKGEELFQAYSAAYWADEYTFTNPTEYFNERQLKQCFPLESVFSGKNKKEYLRRAKLFLKQV